MELRIASVMVDDQAKALDFYVEKLGFVKSKDIPMGEFRWLTVTAPEGAEGVELLLEPMGFPPAVTFQRALFEAGIPATAFMTRNIAVEYDRLNKEGCPLPRRANAYGTGHVRHVRRHLWKSHQSRTAGGLTGRSGRRR